VTYAGRLAVVGLGPGAPAWRSPEASERLACATDVVGYGPYLQLVGELAHAPMLHESDNRQEAERARFALGLAAEGRDVVLVSSGDPGVFAMATAVIEALHDDEAADFGRVEITIVPGITAASAAAARIGAPLGHDFCCISLSDVLKPWDVVVDRLRHASAADLVLALYNPRSRARPHQLAEARDVLLEGRKPDTVVVVGRDVGGPEESIRVTTLGELDPGTVDMRCCVIVGSSQTRVSATGAVYSPRTHEGPRPPLEGPPCPPPLAGSRRDPASGP